MNMNNVTCGSNGCVSAHKGQVASPKYDMDVYVATLFGGEDWVKQKARPNSQHKSHVCFCINYQDPNVTTTTNRI